MTADLELAIPLADLIGPLRRSAATDHDYALSVEIRGTDVVFIYEDLGPVVKLIDPPKLAASEAERAKAREMPDTP